MSTITQADVYERAIGHEFNQVPDGYVLYQAGRDRVHFLNPTAVIVYELCDGKHTVQEIAQFMQESFSLSEAPMEEIRNCLSTLVEEKIVQKSV